MGQAATVVTLLLLLTAGCLGTSDDPDPSTPTPDDGGGTDAAAPGDASGPTRVNATPLEPGTAWTYQTAGLYNTGEQFTIVVAEATDQGYLFAGATPADLVEEVTWGRSWFGHRNLELDRIEADGRGWSWDGLAFPLWDGRTWTDGDVELQATATDVPVPGGTEPGFLIERRLDGSNITYTYAPSVGFLTSYRSPTMTLELVEVSRSQTWTWYEPGASASTGGDLPGSAQVAAGPGETALVSAGAAGGGHVTVVGPPGSQGTPWTFSHDGEEAWTYHAFEPAQGDWHLQTTTTPGALAWGLLVSVSWTEGSVGS